MLSGQQQAACAHPEGRASGQLKLLSFIICDDCGTLIRFLPHADIDYRPLLKLVDETLRAAA